MAALVEEMKVGAVMAQAEGSKEDGTATGAMAEVVALAVVTARAAVLRVMVERGAVVEQTGMLVEDTVATAVGNSSGQAVNALEVAMALTVADT